MKRRAPSRLNPARLGCRSKVSASARGVPPAAGITLTRVAVAQVGGTSLATNTTCVPSGVNRGLLSAAAVAASARTAPVDTSATETSCRVQSSARGEGWCAKAICRLSGDQS